MKHYSAINNEILPFETSWMTIEGIVVTETTQKEKKNATLSHLYVEYKEENKQKTETDSWIQRTKGWFSDRWKEYWGLILYLFQYAHLQMYGCVDLWVCLYGEQVILC